MSNQQNLSLLFRALTFSAEQHKFQYRKGTQKIPYINHPLQVAELLVCVGQQTDLTLIAAAILHDTVEDTAATLEEIENLFGAAVAAIVQEVTDDKTLPKLERKRLQVEQAFRKSDFAKMLKIADKTCNVRDIVLSPPNWTMARKLEYLDWAEQVVHGLRGVNMALEEAFDEWVAKGREQLKMNTEE